jgi:hypothetical protein
LVSRDKETGIFWVKEGWMEIYFIAEDYDGTKECVPVRKCLHKSLLAMWEPMASGGDSAQTYVEATCMALHGA